MSAPAAQSYDEIPYLSLPSPRTHPAHLGFLGRLFGLNCPSIRRARVLELGCAGGGNLLPLAVNYTDSQFLGIDASPRQIAEGQAVIAALGLANLQLGVLDIMALPEELGSFDYILCHGVFSWVPRAVQDRILQICCRHLAPDGVAFVSYNTYPGWHLRAVVRDMMLYHVRARSAPRERIKQSRALLDFLVQSAQGRTEAFRQVLRDEAEIVREHPDAYLFHEHLEEVNEALYFHEFLDRAHGAQLQYLADTEFASMMSSDFGSDVTQLLRDAPREVQEQYLDFLRNRSFRGTLLCHQDRKIAEQVNFTCLQDIDVALEDACELPPSASSPGQPLVLTLSKQTITARAPITQAALRILAGAWPAAIGFPTLAATAMQQTAEASAAGNVPDAFFVVLAQDLLKLYARRLVRLRLDAPPCTRCISERSRVSPLVRWQAQHGDFVTNQRHESLGLSDLGRCLLPQLDGSNDRIALSKYLRQALAQHTRLKQRDPSAPNRLSDEGLTQIVNQAIESFANDALLLP